MKNKKINLVSHTYRLIFVNENLTLIQDMVPFFFIQLHYQNYNVFWHSVNNCVLISVVNNIFKDNDMKMEDIDEGGIGDGKGETNVSDQIEDEQFDDLQEDNNPVDKEQGDQNDEDAVETFNDFEGNFDDAKEEKDSEQEEDDNKSV